MAACGSLQNIFEKSLPKNQTLVEPLSSWGLINPVEQSIEYFGDIHFKDNENESLYSSSLHLSSAPLPEIHPPYDIVSLDKENKNDGEKISTSFYCGSNKKQCRHSDSFSSQNSENLSLCTESLGFESSDDMEDLRSENTLYLQHHEEKISRSRHSKVNKSCKESKTSRMRQGSFPPPISCIGRTGKPWMCFKSYRHDGRFILQEVRIPTQEFLHACRQDGRLRMQLIQSDDEIFEGDDDDDDDDDDDFGSYQEPRTANVTLNDDANHL